MTLRTFLAWLRSLTARHTTDDDDMPRSIVLLLRKYRVFTEAELMAAGERGWQKRFDGSEDPMYFVGHKDTGLFGTDKPIVFVKAGKHLVNMLYSDQPYLGDIEHVAAQLPRKEQRKAWLEHSAWVSLDLLNGKEVAKPDAYAALAKFARHLGDANCSGIYLPKEQIMMPNDGSAEDGLQLLIEKRMPR